MEAEPPRFAFDFSLSLAFVFAFDFGTLFKKAFFRVFCEKTLRAALEGESFCVFGKTTHLRLALKQAAAGGSPQQAVCLQSCNSPLIIAQNRQRLRAHETRALRIFFAESAKKNACL
ncbi:MAG: hypothetical protein HQL97_12220 [Magnetococcales bacterium]|nr:hypothetical protein [Magnetococcales bacterium]